MPVRCRRIVMDDPTLHIPLLVSRSMRDNAVDVLGIRNESSSIGWGGAPQKQQQRMNSSAKT